MLPKNIILFLSLCVITYFSAQKTSDTPITTDQQSHFDTAHKPIILWDIHGVILQKDIKAQARLLWEYDQKREILSNSSWDMAKDMAQGVLQLITHGATAELFAAIARRHNNDALATLVTRLANTQQFIPGTTAIIRELHAKGYTQHIGSNIGTTAFQALITNPAMQTIFNNTIFDLNASQTVTYDPQNLEARIEKPNPAFFQTYLQKNNLKPENVVFIDDNKKNVIAAQSCHLYALQFHNSAQLETILWPLLGLPHTIHIEETHS